MIQIKRWTDGTIIYASQTATTITEAIREVVAAAGKAGIRADLSRANLSRANLSGAYLSRADLSGANLSGAYLSGAYLSGAYLSGAYLGGADLSRADLSGADLSRANLSRADLSGANLSGAYLSGAYLGGADLSRANLSRANLSGAYLSRADLSGADLSRANLSGADLSGADLSGADLSRADLSGADLSRANGVNQWRSQPLMMLLDQPGKIRAYKLVDADGNSPMCKQQGCTPIHYEIGKDYAIPADTDADRDCSHGLNVASMDWCLKERQDGWRVLIVEFEAADIACIPKASDGKFRVHRCTVVGEKDLSEMGIK
ncbi:MAG: pentapeptide repeat-containing protein [Gemmatimonadaceae bacterium]|jgi:uncharacterized protein YjbI with pentapeptide repeats